MQPVEAPLCEMTTGRSHLLLMIMWCELKHDMEPSFRANWRIHLDMECEQEWKRRTVSVPGGVFLNVFMPHSASRRGALKDVWIFFFFFKGAGCSGGWGLVLWQEAMLPSPQHSFTARRDHCDPDSFPGSQNKESVYTYKSRAHGPVNCNWSIFRPSDHDGTKLLFHWIKYELRCLLIVCFCGWKSQSELFRWAEE